MSEHRLDREMRRPAAPAHEQDALGIGRRCRRRGGDLTKRLVMPALYNLRRTGLLPQNLALIGVDLAEGSDASWREHLHGMLESFVGNKAAEFSIDAIDDKVWGSLAECMSYVQGDITRPDHSAL